MAKRPNETDEGGKNGFKRLGARLAKVTKRSPFSVWLSQGDNYQRLKAEIGKYGVRWDEIAQWAYEENLTKQVKITAIAAKRAYERQAKIEGDYAKGGTGKRKARAQPTSAAPVPVQMLPEPESPASATKDPISNFKEKLKKRSS